MAATKFVCKGGILYRFTPGERTPHAPSPGLANASTWKECNGLYLVRDWGVPWVGCSSKAENTPIGLFSAAFPLPSATTCSSRNYSEL